ncbi:MAG TPA: chemotaxis protein CheW [Acidobacteriaceae bacterium]|jgi:chemotaxis signal transduction protein|nr:chemotaxis protein CheW [Acidobacteriaceae bacterium]
MSVRGTTNANEAGNHETNERGGKARGLTVRFRAGGKHFAFSLKAIESIAGYAKLQEFTENTAPPDYAMALNHTAFAGWLSYRGTQVPVFDLGSFFAEEPTPLLLSSRIMLFTRLHDAQQRVGLLAADITDTRQESELEGAELLQPEPLLRELLSEGSGMGETA